MAFPKTECMNIDAKYPIWTKKNKYGDIRKAQKLKYLGETQTPNINEKAAIEEKGKRWR